MDTPKLFQDRLKFYLAIQKLCEGFYKNRTEQLDQINGEAYFGKLWRVLARLFDSQQWDNGEFRPLDLDENLNAIEREVIDVEEQFNTHVSREQKNHEINRYPTKEEEMLK